MTLLFNRSDEVENYRPHWCMSAYCQHYQLALYI